MRGEWKWAKMRGDYFEENKFVRKVWEGHTVGSLSTVSTGIISLICLLPHSAARTLFFLSTNCQQQYLKITTVQRFGLRQISSSSPLVCLCPMCKSKEERKRSHFIWKSHVWYQLLVTIITKKTSYWIKKMDGVKLPIHSVEYYLTMELNSILYVL